MARHFILLFRLSKKDILFSSFEAMPSIYLWGKLSFHNVNNELFLSALKNHDFASAVGSLNVTDKIVLKNGVWFCKCLFL